ncbi:hypothetical protein GALMADRAFT_258757 [Galerina marginata CBS 339.88]|uniref:Novel STAND NTPase 1 domain-containing protein n=1 Tax=Galerina marginata (strain CBS 339.88) TaxID=685588 RepID=A0A067SAC2_GALM3|nr:hypothetical protein GALMADRAFT_258757 [Galerina marginata CBS 339.88]
MSAGCFSWCGLITRRGSKKQRTDEELKSREKLPENRLATINEPKVKGLTSVESQVAQSSSGEELSVNNGAGVPTTAQYFTASAKEILSVLETAGGLIPVPFVKEAIEVAQKIIEVCEEASAVEERVKELQDRVSRIMMVVVAHVTTNTNEEGSQAAVVKAAKGIEQDVKELVSTLGTIKGELSRIGGQNGVVLAIYKDLNMSTLEECMKRLSAALEKFQLTNDLRDSELLRELHNRLGRMEEISRDMKHVVSKVDHASWDIKQMDTKMDNIADKVEGIEDIVQRLATMRPSDTAVLQEIPLKPEIFHGRENLVEEISQLLTKEETSRVCILGPGGMGKTSVSLAVVESPLVRARFLPRNRVWVPCIGAKTAALFLGTLYIQLKVPGDKQVTLQKIISELNASAEPRLLILDNFETPWNVAGAAQKQVEDILRQLAQLNHVAFFVTMRGNQPPCSNTIKWQTKNIQPTDEAACLRIFHEIDPASKDDPDVGRLLSILGHMPFAVTLMANLARDGESTAMDLLDAWSESGPDILSDDPERSMNRSITLSVDSDLVQRNPNAVLLLGILSLLPGGTTKDNLRWWAPTLKKSMLPSAVAALSRAGLLVENKRQDSDSPVLFIMPVVQSFMRHNRIEDDLRKQVYSSCCRYVQDHACRYDDSAFSAKSKALETEDTNIQSMLFGSSTTQHTDASLEALIAFCWHRCDTKPSAELTKYTVTAAETFGLDKYIASALWCLGRTYYQLSDYDLAYDLLQNAYKLFKTLSPGDLKLQQLGAQCGVDLVRTGSGRIVFRDKDTAISLAMEVETKCASLSDDLLHGRCLIEVGEALRRAQRNQEALQYLNRAKTMLQAVGDIPNYATSYQIICRVLYADQRFQEALDAINWAWKLINTIDNLFYQAVIAMDYTIVLFSTDSDTEAWKYLEIALTKASHIGHRTTVADGLAYMGYGYLRKGDYQNAYGAYKAAAEKYVGSMYALVESDCKDNMTRIRDKQLNPDTVVGFHRPHLDIDKSLFYPLVPSQSSTTHVSIPTFISSES